MADTDFQEALVAECADAEGRLTGLALAVPLRRPRDREPLAMHPVRVLECPEALRPLVDDLLIAFSQGLSSLQEGASAWMRALETDLKTPPQVPADLRDPGLLACAIHAADPQGDSDAKAAAHLQAFFDHGRIEGGLGFEKALRGLALDFSLASLGALDALLDRLHAERRPQPDAFLGAQAGLNFLHLLAVYLGETMAQAAGATLGWYTHAQLESIDPGRLDGEADAATALVAVFNGHGTRTGLVFLALDVVACRLFGRADAPTLGDAAAAALPAIRAARRADLVDPASRWLETPERGELWIPRPAWLRGSSLEAWFDALPALWSGGRVVWARLVQANNLLFQPGPHDHPGVILYDGTGRVDPDGLDAVAELIYRLKGTRPRAPGLAYLAANLTHEGVPAYAFPVPPTLGARGVVLTSVLFHRAHLPGGRLAGTRFPVVINDAAPGHAVVLPVRFWPDALRRPWAGA